MKMKLEAKCPACGSIREVKREGKRFRMKRHKVHAGRYSQSYCDGGYPALKEVIAWAMSAKADMQAKVRAAPSMREAARKQLEARLAQIDDQEAEDAATAAAYDRLIVELAKSSESSMPAQVDPGARDD